VKISLPANGISHQPSAISGAARQQALLCRAERSDEAA
jgi:hypothetical protein